ncbi:hypothetical protein C8J57DRAFT_1256450 [Mycena rebaudengoi]|nr:hypothetical protein C8J57DRAFT_1256450 [Mycena rebaudengoi]
MTPNPFAIEELVNLCLNFLVDSDPKLMRYTLISRSWVYPVQSHLFKEFRIGIDSSRALHRSLWKQFKLVLLTSPHLIQHVRHLEVRIHTEETQTLTEICNFPFTHLRTVFLCPVGTLWETPAMALQHLIGRPTIRRVKLRCMFCDPLILGILWGKCSPLIEDIDLTCQEGKRMPDKPSIPLIPYSVLTISWAAEVPWDKVAPMVRNIQVLDLAGLNVALPDDISIFANLIRLRVYLTGETITIALYPGQFNKQRYEQLDAALWMLPVPDPPVVEFEVDPAGYDTIVSHVPKLASTNIVCG